MIKTSIGVQKLRRQIAIKAKADATHRFWGMYCHIWKHDVLMESYRLTWFNKGAPGIDGITFKEIESRIGIIPLLEEISEELKSETYKPSAIRRIEIPKENGKTRTIKIATIKDRVVQGALKLVLEPVFEMDFQSGSYGFRPKRSAHTALARIRTGINVYLRDAIDLDLKSYFDTVRHDILLSKIAARISDEKIMSLCKQILKISGRKGIPQGSLIGPLFSNLYLNEVDKMLEKAQKVTQYKGRNMIEYARFADDLVVLVSRGRYSLRTRLRDKVIYRISEELANLKVEINLEKSKVVNLDEGKPLDFLGFTFRLLAETDKRSYRLAELRPQREIRTAFLREVKKTMKRNRFKAVEDMIREDLNPKIRGWVNYFRCGNSGKDLKFVKSAIEVKVRKFATRQQPKKRGGRRWSKWRPDEIYGKWGLYSDYKVKYVSYDSRKAT